MQTNLDNYRQVFFIVPGALLILLAGFGLYGVRIGATFGAHHHGPRPTPA